VSSIHWVRSVARLTAVLALLFGADDLDVRAANGMNFGGGSSAFISIAATAVTPEAPAQAAPPAGSGGTLSELFSRGGWLGGFAAGFLGSGVLGVLFGRGLIGGLGGAASYAGLLCQIVLLAMLCRLIWTLWRGGDMAGAAALSSRQLADPYLRSRDDLHGSFDAGGSSGAEAAREPGTHSAEVTSPRGRS
jgi:predicted lipid-binding transport protein (Tim44 family)